MHSKRWLTTATTALLAGILPSWTNGAILSVRPDGSGPYPTIQAAILAASPGDTVQLEDGVYRGLGNRDIDFLGKSIVVRSRNGDPGACALDCQGSPSEPHRGFAFRSGEGPGSILEGIAIRGGYLSAISYPGGHGAGVLCDGASPTIRNCDFESNVAHRGTGICVFEGSPKVAQCRFAGNSALTIGGAMQVSYGNATVEDCVFVGNFGLGAGALSCDLGSNWSISGCTFSGNRSTYWGGALMAGSATIRIERSILYGNCADWPGDEVYLASSDTEVTFSCCAVNVAGVYPGAGSVIWEDDPVEEDPLFCHAVTCVEAPTTSGDYFLMEGSPCLPEASPCGARIGALDLGCLNPAQVGPQGEFAGRDGQGLRVFPNPNWGVVNVEVWVESSTSARLRLVNAAGRELGTFDLGTLSAGTSRLVWNVASRGLETTDQPLSGGLHFLILDTESHRRVQKILVLR